MELTFTYKKHHRHVEFFYRAVFGFVQIKGPKVLKLFKCQFTLQLSYFWDSPFEGKIIQAIYISCADINS